ncbi:MAG TPA: HEAT repeat domain-containing protein [Nocardioides sp.]|uniref:HEAT repeat domain-containing protein n=1 Tax=Nocardioides sp. TaxID=35761 RepID=UPI002C1D483E|nr:HEAT repeat domain-containing protein [Nocardioides sp.]HTW18502.1 HEAT repeat domain-containing protein [Nocardioides sp.]
MGVLPPPRDTDRPLGHLVRELAGHLGVPGTVAVCVDLLAGGDPAPYAVEVVYLSGLRVRPEEREAYWFRAWGARGLLHVWTDDAAPAVLRGLHDEHWRPAENCLKVASKRELGEAGPAAVGLLGHDLPRMRAQAVRLLGIAGDTEHVDAVHATLDDPDPGVRQAAGRALDRMTLRLDLA